MEYHYCGKFKKGVHIQNDCIYKHIYTYIHKYRYMCGTANRRRGLSFWLNDEEKEVSYQGSGCKK